MTQELDLRRYLSIVQYWWWLLLGVTVAAAASAYIIFARQQPIYQATTTILIDEAPQASAGADYQSVLLSERRARTYAEVLTTEPLLREVAQEVDASLDVAALREAIVVRPMRDTQLIRVQVRDTDPARATTIANTLVTTFAKQTEELQASRYAASKETLEEQLALLQNEIEQHEERLEERIDSATREQVNAALSEARQSYAGLLQSYEQIRLAEAQTQSGVVQIEPAVTPEEPVAPRVLLNTVLAAIVGLLLALGGVVLRELLDDTVKNPEAVAQDLDMPLLGVLSLARQTDTSKPIVAAQPRSPSAEAFRSLRTNLQYASVNKPLHTLLITSPLSGEGKSHLAVNLATVLAQGGRRVIVLDADLRRPVLHTRLGIANRSGLSELFVQPELHLNGSVRATDIKNVSVVTSGAVPPNPAELMGSERMLEILRQVQQHADIVIIDAPPTLPVTDAAVLAPRVDGVLLVVRDGRTKLAAAKQAVEQLRHVNANLLGVVINGVSSGRMRYGYSYQGYGRYDYNGGDGGAPPKLGMRGWFQRKRKRERKVDVQS